MNQQVIFLGLTFVVIYFFILLPQIRKGKKQRQFIQDLQKGDKVVTTGGIHGKIAELKELKVVVDAGNGVKLTIDRSAINMDATVLANSDKEA